MWCCASPPTQQPSIHSFLPACLLPCFSGRRKKRTGTKASAFVSYQVFLMGGIKRVKIIVSLTDHRACQKMDFTYLKGGQWRVCFSQKFLNIMQVMNVRTSIHSSLVLFSVYKSDNLQYNTLVRWANGTSKLSTKCLTFQVFFFS